MPVFDCEFKDVPGYLGYCMNVEGVLKRLSYQDIVGRQRPEKVISQRLDSNGYLQVEVNVSGKTTSAKLHRLLALTYIPNPEALPQINHKDGDKLNNQIDNLEWVSSKDNVLHSYKLGLASNARERHPQTKLTEDLVRELRAKRAAGEKLRELADLYSITVSAVCKITKGVNWKL